MRLVLRFQDEITAQLAQFVRYGWDIALVREASAPMRVKLEVAAVGHHCHFIASRATNEYPYNYAPP